MRIHIQAETTLVSEFRKQAHSQPRKIAIEDGGNRWTYGELAARVTELAEGLLEGGITPLSYVGIYLQPSADLIATLLAILEVGAAYVPIDRSAPLERARFIASDANLLFVVTDDPQLDYSPFLQLDVLRRGEGLGETVQSTPPVIGCHAGAYVIYTSGSSGQPKGVICTHYNVLRLLTSTRDEFSFSRNDRWTLFHSIGFDFSVWEIFGSLLHGGTLVVVPPEVARDTRLFAKLLMDREVTVLNQTPSAFYNLLSLAESRSLDVFATLRVVILGGERVQVAKLRRWFERESISRPKLVNMYGITETTVHVTYKELRTEDILTSAHSSPIGRPISDLTVYLLNSDLQPVQDGEPGEICVSGPGVARGYLNRPELTAQRFVRNPCDGEATASVLYRSGDLGQRSSAGELYYLGRLDRQVKIRGYRIELGEIESSLLSAAGVSTAYVTALESEADDKRLIAYVVPDAKLWPGALPEADLSGEMPEVIPSESTSLIRQLRASLTKVLPGYMIPAQIYLLPELPLTVNGKVDERKLAEAASIRARAPRQPTDSIEQTVKAIWLDILKLQDVDADVSLADTGAHSLAIVMIAMRLYEAFGVEISIDELRGESSIISIAKTIRQTAQLQRA